MEEERERGRERRMEWKPAFVFVHLLCVLLDGIDGICVRVWENRNCGL